MKSCCLIKISLMGADMNRKETGAVPGTMITESDRALQAIEENLFAYIRAVAAAEGNEYNEDAQSLSYSAGFTAPSMLSACVYNFQNNEKEVKAAVSEKLAFFRERGVPLLWTTGPSSPRELNEALKKAGMMHVQKQAGMAMDLSRLDENLEIPVGVEVFEVDKESQLLPWFSLFNASFEQAPALSPLMAERYGKIFLNRDLPMRHYLATWQGRPAATASFYSDKEVTGIYNIVTAPGARGRGIGEFMTRYALHEGKKRGDTLAILQATEKGEPVYRRIGFERLCSLDLYVKLYGSSLLMVPINLLRVKISNLIGSWVSW